MAAKKKAKTTDEDALMAAMAADAAAPREASPDALARITAAVTEMQNAEREAARLAALLEEQTRRVRTLREATLPALLDEAGVKELTLQDDFRLERTEEVFASIARQNEAAATKWLVANNYGSIIKSAFSIPFDKGDVKQMRTVAQLLKKARIAFEIRTGVHAQTLKAFVREQLQAGKQLPKAITVHVQPVAVLRAPRKSRKMVTNQ